MIGEEMLDNIRFLAAMSVGARRYMDLDEDAIRTEAMSVASQAIEDNVDDLVEQESMLVEIRRAIDEAIASSR